MADSAPNHMTPDEFRHWGKEVIEWIASYMESVDTLPVLAQVTPGEIRAKLPASAPEHGESFDQILKDIDDIVMPGITHWQSPNFFAFFPGNVSAPAILGDLLCAGLGVQGMLWTTSPACTEVETHVLDWLADMLALPNKFKSTSTGGGVIQDTASSSVLCALLAAREQANNFESNRRGLDVTHTVYTSTQTHSSVEKAVKIAGIGTDNLRTIDVDEQFAMRPELLAKAIAADKAAGHQPCFVCATVGTTSSTAIDPVRAIGEICAQEGLWLHVDAAHSGNAMVCPEFRYMQDGIELASSYCFNPHKWLLTNLDCDSLFVANRAVLIKTLSVLPEYLINQATESGAVIDYRDWHVPLGRRFRSLKLWCVIRHYGVEGLQRYIRGHIALTQQFVSWVKEHSSFELCAPVPVNLVCFRHVAGDAFNQRLLDELNASGALYLTHTRLNDQLVLRMSIGSTPTKLEHVEAAWCAIVKTAGHLEMLAPLS